MMATDEEIRKEAKWILSNCLIGYTISKIEEGIRRGIQMEREKPNKYKMFYDHIKTHLKPDQEVICKICGKSAKTIWND